MMRSNMCPTCQRREVDTATYYSIGEKMLHSSPYLAFNCRACSSEMEDQDEFYQSPTHFHFPDLDPID